MEPPKIESGLAVQKHERRDRSEARAHDRGNDNLRGKTGPLVVTWPLPALAALAYAAAAPAPSGAGTPLPMYRASPTATSEWRLP